jgi:pSer/pThr/pTyr-binding forkhead associated (FHA) protein
MTGVVFLIFRIILLACLFGFLAWALYTIWRDLKTQSTLISAPQIPTLFLTRLGESDNNSKEFNQLEVYIGRSANSDFPIADHTVSARHSRLSYHHNQWWLEDLRSTNGTYLNDERVTVPTVIVTGDEIRCGQVDLTIGIEEKNW